MATSVWYDFYSYIFINSVKEDLFTIKIDRDRSFPLLDLSTMFASLRVDEGELDVSPLFLENDLLKISKILGLFFLMHGKTSKDFKQRFSIYCSWIFCSMDCLQLLFIRLLEAVSWTTQRFLTRKFWLQNRSLLLTNKYDSECSQKFYFSSE